MTRVGIIRCEKNQDRCPLTNCLRCLTETREGFQMYEAAAPAGVFTCRCPGDGAVQQAKILKSKGAEVIHFCTCTFANKTDGDWRLSQGGYCPHVDALIEKVHREAGIACVKGTAHLPEGYTPQRWTP